MKDRIVSLAHHRSRSSLTIRHGHTRYDDGVQMLMSCQASVAFVNGCLESVTNRQWGLVSSSEAAANDRAVTGGSSGVQRGSCPLVGMTTRTMKYQRRTYTVTEAAELIGISRSTAYDLVSKGELHAIRLGRRWVVPVSTVTSIVGSRPTAPREAELS